MVARARRFRGKPFLPVFGGKQYLPVFGGTVGRKEMKGFLKQGELIQKIKWKVIPSLCFWHKE